MSWGTVRQYLVSAFVSLVVTGAFLAYLLVRRGEYTISVLNQSLAIGSMMIIALVLLIGPITRMYDKWDKWLIYRKELGIMGFFLALAHGYISGFMIPARFNLDYFLGPGLLGFVFGLAGLVILGILFVFSIEIIISLINRRSWWALQNWGIRLAGLSVMAHMIIIRNVSWMAWWNHQPAGGPPLAAGYLPPAGLLAIVFAFLVLATRVIEFLGVSISRLIFPLLLLASILAWIGLFARGLNLV